ncbi:MAG: OmpA family protein [Bauldia sp.]|nr:OmpA family protein [Bauldia sp.]
MSDGAEQGEDEATGFFPGLVRLIRGWLLPAAVASTLLAGGAVALRLSDVEADLAERVMARLDQGGYSWLTVEVDGRAIVLSGTAPSLVEQSDVRDAVAAVWGVGAIDDRTDLIPLVNPFDWAAARAGNTITLSGHVPSESVRAALHALVAANQPQGLVEDRTTLARGAPPDFQQAAEFGLRLLANLVDGTVALLGTELSAEGLSIDTPRYENVLELAESARPAGYALARNAILPPRADPYVWSLTFFGDRVVIRGAVPSNLLATSLAAAVSVAVPDKPVVDESQLASGAPERFEAVARHALALAAHLVDGEVTLTGTQIGIYGRARTPESYETLLAVLAEPSPEGMSITFDIVPALAPAYVFEAVRDGIGVQVMGFMPSEQARADVLAEANALFGGAVTDNLQIADGAPRMDWIGAAKFALGQVSRLGVGSARIADHRYFVTGSAATSEGYETITNQLAAVLPASLELDESLVLAPLAQPYRFTAAVGPDAVTLGGNAPTARIREAFVAAAAIRFDPLPVNGTISLASGAPAGFDAAVLAGLQAISRLGAGRLEIVDTRVSVDGLAPHEAAVDRIEQQLATALPAGFTREAALTVQPPESRVTPAECQSLLDQELGAGTVKFAEGAATIAPESQGRLDRLVAIIQRCPDAEVEIGGHTDAGGSNAVNLTLSQARAEAVVEYLVQAGVQGDRLSAVGYGETSPVASNDTAEGRARNRRIEFTIQEP